MIISTCLCGDCGQEGLKTTRLDFGEFLAWMHLSDWTYRNLSGEWEVFCPNCSLKNNRQIELLYDNHP